MRKRITVMTLAAALALAALAAFAQDGTSPTSAFQALNQELESLQRQAQLERSLDGKVRIVEQIQARFVSFRKDYPGFDASFGVGRQQGRRYQHDEAGRRQEQKPENGNDAGK